jgi:hypothetical protein
MREARVEKFENFEFNNFFGENRAVYEVMFKKYGTAGQAAEDNRIWRMRFAYWITKAIGTQSEYVMIFAFPR